MIDHGGRIGAAVADLEQAELERAEQLARQFWRRLMTATDRLLERLEQLNLLDRTRISNAMGLEILQLEAAVYGTPAAPQGPGKIAHALDRVYDMQDVIMPHLHSWPWLPGGREEE